MDDLKQRMKRYRTNDYCDPNDKSPGRFVAETLNRQDDEMALAAAYMAEHPEDEDEPITEEWLISLGFKHDREVAGVRHIRLENSVYGVDVSVTKFGCRTWWHFRNGVSVDIIDPETKGEARRLLAALKIKFT